MHTTDSNDYQYLFGNEYNLLIRKEVFQAKLMKKHQREKRLQLGDANSSYIETMKMKEKKKEENNRSIFKYLKVYNK